MNNTNQVPFLRTSRSFPEDPHQLTVEVNRAYVDIANSVNSRIIGVFSDNVSVQTGETWTIKGRNYKSFRQIFPFTSAASIVHNINFRGVYFVSPRSYGVYTNGTNYFGVIFGSGNTITGQTSFFVTPTNIIIRMDVAAPAITSGFIDLEWLSNV